MFRNTNRFPFNKTTHIVKRDQIIMSLNKQAKFCFKKQFCCVFFEKSEIYGLCFPSGSKTYEFPDLQEYRHTTSTSIILYSLSSPSLQCLFLLGREILFITKSVSCRYYITYNFFMSQHRFI